MPVLYTTSSEYTPQKSPYHFSQSLAHQWLHSRSTKINTIGQPIQHKSQYQARQCTMTPSPSPTSLIYQNSALIRLSQDLSRQCTMTPSPSPSPYRNSILLRRSH